jgi:transposase InsO family protein
MRKLGSEEQYILVLIDCNTKFIWTWALKLRDAESVAEKIEPFLKEEKFKKLQSDNGGEFRNKILANIVEKINLEREENQKLKQVHGRPRKPQVQGQVERVNGTLKSILLSLCGNDMDNWENHLPRATLIYNTKYHRTIKVFCFYIC